MPVNIVITTTGELFAAAIAECHRLSEEIRALSDVAQRPLMPEETPETRYHQIAKLGKRLADAFSAMDAVIQHTIDQHMQHAAQSEPTPQPKAKGEPDPNSN